MCDGDSVLLYAAGVLIFTTSLSRPWSNRRCRWHVRVSTSGRYKRAVSRTRRQAAIPQDPALKMLGLPDHRTTGSHIRAL